ncbi:hypothetical protein ECBP1_0082 [Escherichia phage ECBP1]|uniref:Uncharacterized protein n=1 Tax=Escherichia phage ECBP1 TaxID=1604356 RepID=J9RVR9_9CAUD|nr:hypothetical protein ECBP1_0082 [Escherichia phage ECBP1]AFR52032.1 hypothetical protein ECBP1_0082 [Escherichia phage ECBP1]
MKLNTSPYPVQLEVVLDRDTFIKKYKKLKGYEPDLEGCKGYTTYSDNKVLMGIFSDPLPTLIHEVNHFCLWVFDYIGMPINSSNSEAYCYYMDSILEQVLKNER